MMCYCQRNYQVGVEMTQQCKYVALNGNCYGDEVIAALTVANCVHFQVIYCTMLALLVKHALETDVTTYSITIVCNL